jgi:hypothetical protein
MSISHPASAVDTAADQPWWVTAIVIIGALGVLSLTVGALFGGQTVLAAGQHMNAAAHAWARYAAAYNVALGLALLALLAIRARRILAGTLVQAAFAEVLLAVVAIVDHRWEQIPADIILLAAFLLAASRLFGQPPWRAAAWRDSH